MNLEVGDFIEFLPTGKRQVITYVDDKKFSALPGSLNPNANIFFPLRKLEESVDKKLFKIIKKDLSGEN
jgi:hypothetical protein